MALFALARAERHRRNRPSKLCGSGCRRVSFDQAAIYAWLLCQPERVLRVRAQWCEALLAAQEDGELSTAELWVISNIQSGRCRVRKQKKALVSTRAFYDLSATRQDSECALQPIVLRRF